MDLKETNKNLNQIKADEDTKDALLGLIDKKISDDTEKMIAEIKSFRIELNTKLESSIGALKDGILSNQSENKFTQWLVIALFTVVSIAIGIFNFKNK